MTVRKLIATITLIATVSIGLASAQMPDGSVYVLHSGAHVGAPLSIGMSSWKRAALWPA